jgi:osmoprotectant transport system permease protein
VSAAAPSGRANRLSPTTLALALALVAVVLAMPHLRGPMHLLFPEVERPIYERASFAALTLRHVELVLASSAAATLIGVGAGIFATRESGAEFAPLIGALTAIGQTFPPVAVLALSVPLLGYGGPPTFLALAIYAVLPIAESTIAGLRAVPGEVKEAAVGLGFSPARRLVDVELPLASPIILNGIRIAIIINVGTATVGSTIGALTLGSPIIEGLAASNTAYVVEGAVVVALLAMWLDRLLDDLARWASLHAGTPRALAES